LGTAAAAAAAAAGPSASFRGELSGYVFCTPGANGTTGYYPDRRPVGDADVLAAGARYCS
jgi:hypothetical protein